MKSSSLCDVNNSGVASPKLILKLDVVVLLVTSEQILPSNVSICPRWHRNLDTTEMCNTKCYRYRWGEGVCGIGSTPRGVYHAASKVLLVWHRLVFPGQYKHSSRCFACLKLTFKHALYFWYCCGIVCAGRLCGDQRKGLYLVAYCVQPKKKTIGSVKK